MWYEPFFIKYDAYEQIQNQNYKPSNLNGAILLFSSKSKIKFDYYEF